jgi:hypothetical protein
MADATRRGFGGGSSPSRTFDSPAGKAGRLFKGEAGVMRRDWAVPGRASSVASAIYPLRPWVWIPSTKYR